MESKNNWVHTKRSDDRQDAIAALYEIKQKEKKQAIEIQLQTIWNNIGCDRPANHDEIAAFILNDVNESADDNRWHSGDIAIGFRRYLEKNLE